MLTGECKQVVCTLSLTGAESASRYVPLAYRGLPMALV